MCLVMNSVRRLTHSNLIVSKSCEWTNKFNRRSQPSVRIYEIPFIKIKVECHVLLVVGVE